MPRVDVILDMEPYDLIDEYQNNTYQKPKKIHEKTIRIPEKLFKDAIHEGLIEKTDDGYVFIGNYKDLKGFKKRKH